MKKRLLALTLAAAMVLALAACGGKSAQEGGQSAPESAPAPQETAPAADPVQAPAAGEPDSAVSDSAAPAPADEPSQAPADEPSLAPQPGPADPAATEPAAGPAPAPAAKEVAVSEVYAAVAKAAGVSYDDMSAVADAFYTALSSADVSEFTFRQPAMSAQLEEIFIARANPGRAEAVKAACAARQADLAEEAVLYGENGRFVESYQLVTQGDWVLFCVCENASAAVNAFKTATK